MLSRFAKLLFCCLLILLLTRCSSIRQVTPLPKGNSALSLSIGGPFTKVGDITTPLPFLSLGYSFGFTDRITLESGIHLTSLAFGLLQLDPGMSWFVFTPHGIQPGLIVSPRVFLMTNFKPESVRIYPNLDLTFTWKLPYDMGLYSGIRNWIEPASIRSDGNIQTNHLLVAPFIGFLVSRNRWSYQIESLIYTPNLKNTGRPLKNVGFGENGIFGLFFGVSRTFGGR
jgi:hypothetical protein